MRRLVQLSSSLVVALAVVSATALPAHAQEPKSAAAAKELALLLAGKKMDAVAVRAPGSTDEFLAALAFPGQLIVVSAKYAAPPLLNEKLARSEYRDVYIELNSASVPDSRFFITDIGADGLRPKRAKRDDPFDVRDAAGKPFNFDGNWREDKMSEADYMKVHAETDERYTQILTALLGEAKK
jgi:hypothetical protein